MKTNYQIAVIIPTRNRLHELCNLLESLRRQESTLNQIVVIDSSDNTDCSKLCSDLPLSIEYIHTDIRSAAIQRNIGISQISENITHVAFLDDDVLIESNYFSELISELTEKKGVGISGIALNPNTNLRRTKPMGVAGFFHRLFFLDSLIDGKLLSSGINVPVRDYAGTTVEVDWLIGCSVWDFKKIQDLRFEEDFLGQSLGEDVIFSLLASRKGKLLTNPRIVISHFESPIGRPDSSEFYRMWTRNRYRLIKVMNQGFKGKISFIWSNVGQSLILLYQLILGKANSSKSILVIATETLRSLIPKEF